MFPETVENVLGKIFEPWQDISIKSKRQIIILVVQGAHVNILTFNEDVTGMGTDARMGFAAWLLACRL